MLYCLPLLNAKIKLDRKALKRLGIHALTLTLILTVYITIRSSLNEDRLGLLLSSIFNLPWIMFQSFFIGIYTSFGSILAGTNTFLNAPSNSRLFIFTISLVALLFGFSFSESRKQQSKKTSDEAAGDNQNEIKSKQRHILALGAIGLLGLGLGYLLPFTHFPPTQLAGRLTSIHLPSGFGFSLTLTSLFMILYSRFKAPTKKRVLVAVTIVLLSAFSGYQHIIQLDMVKSFYNQGWFWSRITQFCPHLEEDTVIIIEKEALSETKYIFTYSWADPYILDLLYRFPKEWDQPPTVLTVRSGWESDLVFENGKWVYHWNDYFSSALVDGKIINIK